MPRRIERRDTYRLTAPLFAEGVTLPYIQNADGISAAVLAYILGEDPCPFGELPLYYLAMVSKSVQAPNAIFAALVLPSWKNSADRETYPNARLVTLTSDPAASSSDPLDGAHPVMIALAQHAETWAGMGYPLAWRSRKRPVGSEVQFTLEPDLLTAVDPLRLAQPLDLPLEAWEHYRQQPHFVLLQRPEDTPETLALRHLRFLAKRLSPLPPIPQWAMFLWERARATGEATPLTTWCFDPRRDASPDLLRRWPQATGPWLSGAYLCRPNLPRLQEDLGEALRDRLREGA